MKKTYWLKLEISTRKRWNKCKIGGSKNDIEQLANSIFPLPWEYVTLKETDKSNGTTKKQNRFPLLAVADSK